MSEIGFHALFQILPSPIAVFPCDYVLGIGQPCLEPSGFAVQRSMTSECGGVPSSQLVQQLSSFLLNIFKISLGG